MPYSLDTSALVEPWRDHYPKRIFSGFWERYEDLIASGEAVAIQEVYEELRRRDDELFAWAAERREMFVDLEEDIQLALRDVLSVSERMIGSQKGRSAADPWVIALARARGLTVVTMERPNGKLNKPKIPDACNALGVKCIDVLGLIDEQGWQFPG